MAPMSRNFRLLNLWLPKSPLRWHPQYLPRIQTNRTPASLANIFRASNFGSKGLQTKRKKKYRICILQQTNSFHLLQLYFCLKKRLSHRLNSLFHSRCNLFSHHRLFCHQKHLFRNLKNLFRHHKHPCRHPKVSISQKDFLHHPKDPFLDSKHLSVHPKRLFHRPKRLFLLPNYLFHRPKRLFLRPNHLFHRPNHLFHRPNHLFQRPNHLFQRPNHLFHRPNPLFHSPQHLFCPLSLSINSRSPLSPLTILLSYRSNLPSHIKVLIYLNSLFQLINLLRQDFKILFHHPTRGRLPLPTKWPINLIVLSTLPVLQSFSQQNFPLKPTDKIRQPTESEKILKQTWTRTVLCPPKRIRRYKTRLKTCNSSLHRELNILLSQHHLLTNKWTEEVANFKSEPSNRHWQSSNPFLLVTELQIDSKSNLLYNLHTLWTIYKIRHKKCLGTQKVSHETQVQHNIIHIQGN